MCIAPVLPIVPAYIEFAVIILAFKVPVKVPLAPLKVAPILPIVPAFIIAAAIVPLLVRLVNVPRLVTFGCEAVVSHPVSKAPLLPIVAALIVPLLVRLVKVQRLVI